MPCYRCGTRQVDPDRGASPWARGVHGGHQVLVCPCCQTGPDWAAELDRCARCEGTHLVRRLGEVECRDCGYLRWSDGEFPFDLPDGGSARQLDGDPRLAEEVARALAKLFDASARGRIAQR